MMRTIYFLHTPNREESFSNSYTAACCVALLADLQGISLDVFGIEDCLEKNGTFEFGCCKVVKKVMKICCCYTS